MKRVDGIFRLLFRIQQISEKEIEIGMIPNEIYVTYQCPKQRKEKAENVSKERGRDIKIKYDILHEMQKKSQRRI